MKYQSITLFIQQIQVALRSLLLVLCLALLPAIPSNSYFAAFSQNNSPAPILKPDQPVEDVFKELPHLYWIHVKAGQYLRVAADQRGVELEVYLVAADGRLIVKVTNPHGRLERVFVSMVVEESGNFQLVLNPLKDAKLKSYKVTIEEQRTATESDNQRVSAERTFMLAEQFRAQGTSDSRRRALAAYEEVLPIWQRLRERREQALTLNSLGQLHSSFNEKQKALASHERALALWRAIGDVHETAATLNDLGLIYDRLDEKLKALDNFQESLSLWRASGDRFGEAYTIQNLAQTYAEFGDRSKSLHHYNQALKIWRETDNRQWAAFSLAAIGHVYDSSHDYQKALSHYYQAAQIWNTEPDVFGKDYINLKWWLVTQARASESSAGAAMMDRVTPAASPAVTAAAGQNAARATGPPSSPARASNQTLRTHDLSKEPELWNQINSLNDPAAFAVYLREFPDGAFVEQATARIKESTGLGDWTPEQAASQRNWLALTRRQLKLRNETDIGRITTVERYPTIETPDPVEAEQEFKVLVSLTMNVVTAEKTTVIKDGKPTDNGVTLGLPDQDGWEIEVVLMAPDFVLPDGNSAQLFLPRNGDSTPVRFKVKSKPISGLQQSSKLSATLWSKNVYLGKIERDITVRNSSESKARSLTNSPTVPQPIQNTPRPQSASYKLNHGAADLTVVICKSPNSNQLQMFIFSNYLTKTEPTPFNNEGLAKWLGEKYNIMFQKSAQLAELPKPSAAGVSQQARDFMKGFGRQLYLEFCPPALKKAFWELSKRLGPDFKTIQIYSNDFELPWELMRPIGPDGGEREFLGVEFAVGRWHLNQSSTGMDVPPQSLSINKLIVIAPTYKGFKSLRSQEIETLKLINGYERWGGQLSDFRRLFQEFPLGVIYFAGHGTVNSTRPDIWEYSIELEDGPLDVTTWRGMTNRQSNNHPLLFFNACEIGQTHRVANFIDGWAPAVLEAGASGYIGALWPVSDQGAAEFGVNFYQELGRRLKLGPASVAETLRETRRKFLENGDPTFLSYVYFGDANLELGPQPAEQ